MYKDLGIVDQMTKNGVTTNSNVPLSGDKYSSFKSNTHMVSMQFTARTRPLE